MDAVGAEVVNPNYGMKTNEEKQERISLKKVGGKFVIFNSNGEKLSKPFNSPKEAQDFARKAHLIITGRISYDSVSVNDMPFWEIKRNYESTKNGSKYPAIKRKNDTEYQKAVKEIKLAKQMKQADLDLAKSISMSKEHLNLKPVESALNGISNARDKLKAMVQKIQQKYSVNVSEAAVDSVSVNDAVSIRRVANADPEDSHITVKFKDGKLHDYSFKSVKAAMDYIMQGNYKGAVVVGFPSRKVLAK